jgi:hypothetical protein
MSSRRSFVRNLAVVSLAAAFSPRGSAAVVQSLMKCSGEPAPHPLSCAAFTPLQGENFSVRSTTGVRQTWQLGSVQKYERGPQLENFSLQFTGPAAGAVAEGTYHVSHRSLGEVELFVVARPRADLTIGYEAVINRLV